MKRNSKHGCKLFGLWFGTFAALGLGACTRAPSQASDASLSSEDEESGDHGSDGVDSENEDDPPGDGDDNTPADDDDDAAGDDDGADDSGDDDDGDGGDDDDIGDDDGDDDDGDDDDGDDDGDDDDGADDDDEGDDDDGANDGELVTVTPESNDGPLRNPYRGWNTKWYDEAQPKYSSIGGLSLQWGDFQTGIGEYDWAKMDEYMNDKGTRGSFINMNVFSDKMKTTNNAPDFIYDNVDVKSYDHNDAQYTLTDCNDPYYLEHVARFIEAFYAHYRDSKRIHAINLGFLGYYGEWSKWPFPSDVYSIAEASKQTLLDGFLEYRSKGFVGGRYTKEELFKGYVGEPLGFGDGYFRPNHSHHKEFTDNIGEYWKHGPIGGETPPDMTDENWDALFNEQTGLEMLAAGHYSNMKGAFGNATDPKYQEGFDRLARRWGYVYELTEIVYNTNFLVGGELTVTVSGRNKGVAPFYYPWEVEVGLLADGEAVETHRIDGDPRQWMPDASFEAAGRVQIDAAAGSYQLAIRVIYNGASSDPSPAWRELDARNAYVVFANELEVLEGSWGSNDLLQGGWAIVGPLEVVASMGIGAE